MTQNMQDRRQTNWLLVIVLWLAGVGAAAQFAKISVTLTALGDHYGAAPAQTGLVLSVVAFVGLLFGATAGVVVGRGAIKAMLILALCLGTLISAGQAVLPPLHWLLASRVLEGVSHLIIVVAAPTTMIAASAPRHRSIVMGLWGTFFGVAFAVTAWAGSPLLASGGPPALYLAHAGLMAVLALLIALMAPRLERSEPADARVTWKTWLAARTAEHVEIYSDRRTAIPGICFMCHTAMFVVLLTFVPRLAPPEDAATLGVLLPLISILGAFGAGIIAQHVLSPIRLTITAFAAVGVAVIGFHFATNGNNAIMPAAILLLAVSGLVQGTVFTLIPALCDTTPLQARANGTVAQMGSLGATVGPPIFATTIHEFGSGGLMVPVVILCGAGILIVAIGTRSRR